MQLTSCVYHVRYAAWRVVVFNKMGERIDVVRHVRLHAVAYIGTLLLHNSS